MATGVCSNTLPMPVVSDGALALGSSGVNASPSNDDEQPDAERTEYRRLLGVSPRR
jgi:hypothetical protein